MEKILITICARGGSKGIPGKNIKTLAGKPLLAYTIDLARRFQAHHSATDILLSTDSQEIRHVAAAYGLESDYCRPEALAGDTAGKVAAIADALRYAEQTTASVYDYVLDLDVTSPLRTLDDLMAALQELRVDADAVNLFSVNPAARNPYFNMVEQNPNGYYSLSKQFAKGVTSRQSAPKVYELNASFYFYRRTFFSDGYTGAITPRSRIYVMPHICFDLDEPIDFEFISYLIVNNKLNFEL